VGEMQKYIRCAGVKPVQYHTAASVLHEHQQQQQQRVIASFIMRIVPPIYRQAFTPVSSHVCG